MKPKTIVALALLLFIGAAFGYRIMTETRPPGSAPAATTTPRADTAAQPATVPAAGGQAPVAPPEPAAQLPAAGTTDAKAPAASAVKIVAYYFHSTTRCTTCLTIEDYAKEALLTGFADERKRGSLRFAPVNIEEPENEHFSSDFSLASSSLVLVRFVDGKQTSWKILEKVWELVRDRDAFYRYVRSETRAMFTETKG